MKKNDENKNALQSGNSGRTIKKLIYRCIVARIGEKSKMLGYEYDGQYIENSKALGYIKEQAMRHEYDKELVLDWLWDELQENTKLRKEFEEWFFQDVSHDIDESEIELGNQIDIDFDLGR